MSNKKTSCNKPLGVLAVILLSVGALFPLFNAFAASGYTITYKGANGETIAATTAEAGSTVSLYYAK
jgi:hypothetical protein